MTDDELREPESGDTHANSDAEEAGLGEEAAVTPDASYEGESAGWQEITAALAAVRESVDRQQEMRARDQDVIANLKAEVDSLRRGELREAQRPLLSSLVRLCDSVDAALEQEDSDQETLAFLREGLVDVLEGAGLEHVAVVEGEAFTRGPHRAVGRVTTSDQDLDKTIAHVKRGGLAWPEGEVFRPAEVDVFVFDARSATESEQERNDGDE